MQAMIYKIMYLPGIFKPYLSFGRMNIHVYRFGRYIHIQHKSRLPSGIQNIRVGTLDRVRNQRIFDGPAIDVEIL